MSAAARFSSSADRLHKFAIKYECDTITENQQNSPMPKQLLYGDGDTLFTGPGTNFMTSMFLLYGSCDSFSTFHFRCETGETIDELLTNCQYMTAFHKNQ